MLADIARGLRKKAEVSMNVANDNQGSDAPASRKRLVNPYATVKDGVPVTYRSKTARRD